MLEGKIALVTGAAEAESLGLPCWISLSSLLRYLTQYCSGKRELGVGSSSQSSSSTFVMGGGP